jgi:hypothetical protein
MPLLRQNPAHYAVFLSIQVNRYTEYRFFASPTLRLMVAGAGNRSTAIHVNWRPLDQVKAVEEELKSLLVRDSAT